MRTRRVNVRGIVFKDGKLLVGRTKDHEGNTQDFWSILGGGLEENEGITDAIHREMIEEAGIAPKVGKLLFLQQFNDGIKEQLELFFHIENPEDYEGIDISTTSHGTLELGACEFVDPKTSNVLPEFLQTIDIADYIANDKPVYISNAL